VDFSNLGTCWVCIRYDLVEQTKAAQARKPLASGALEEKQIENAGENGHSINKANGFSNGGDIGSVEGGRPVEKSGVGPSQQQRMSLNERVAPPSV